MTDLYLTPHIREPQSYTLGFYLKQGGYGAPAPVMPPPMIAAWAPFLLFLLVGETVLIQSEE